MAQHGGVIIECTLGVIYGQRCFFGFRFCTFQRHFGMYVAVCWVGCFYLIGGIPELAMSVRWGVIHGCRYVAVLSVAFLYECYERESE